MAEPQSSPNPNLTPTSQSPCDECRSNPWKYRCPGCSAITCSLPCVKSHKLRTGCTGQKTHSEVVPISKFDDNLLLSDYNFLEEAKRVAESAQRGRYGIGGRFYVLPCNLKMLKDAARRRRTKILFLPFGMSRRERNQSRYDKRTNTISWTIEWRFHSTDIVQIDHGVDEHTSIQSAVKKYLLPGPWNHPLRSFCNEEMDNLKFFIQKNKNPKPIFRELKASDPIGRQMAGILIVEYPVIHVYLPSHSCNFQVETFTKPSFVNEKPSQIVEVVSGPNGTVFREEEINDDGSLETVVVDLMHCTKPAALLDSRNPKDVAEAAAPNSLGDKSLETSWETEGPILINDFDFDFEQDLKDAYSDLMRESNPDDFLCFDSIIEGERLESKPGAALALSGISCMEAEEGEVEEELEEGEIPS